ncbi:2-C-methyl-D-erythritol 4-phosphate cytidylyltransferase [bioreactor metagenome]|uniref:2-C-methyl-D-erythritol 4-phosphate cytidylyltransferase n=1 Tax=bioreactor metagenome TaxID=1076179 RepID=A0A645GGM8_9ZZZZ
MYAGKFCSAVIVAAGNGKRMGTSISKQYLMLGDKTIIEHTVDAFINCVVVDEIIIVASPIGIEECRNLFSDKPIRYALGGAERYNSVYNGICETSEKSDIVLVHDGVRPFVSKNTIISSIEAAIENGACAVGVKSKDTVKICDDKGFVISTPVRDNVYSIQTPQTFQKDIIVKSYKKAFESCIFGTDDAALVENAGFAVKIVSGSYENIKITTPDDLIVGEKIITKDNLGGGSN